MKEGDLSKYTFDGQRPDEEVIFVVRRHPWVLAQAGFLIVALVVVLVLSFLFFGFSKVTSLLIAALAVFFLFYGFYQWFIYNNYLYILTNQRIIIIEQGGFFSRKIIEAELDKIQNVTVEVKGLMKTFLNFGDILMRTAGIDPVIVLSNIENPYAAQQKIIKYCKQISEDSKNTPKNIIR